MTLPPRAASAGSSYFGVRIVRHVRRDMADLAARGYSGVLHTFSENDFAYYRGTMREIVEASHDAGLTVQASPWGLGRTFGGEAESRWVTFHPEECQVLDDGRRVAGACLNSAAYRAFCKEWADWVLECGVDSVFWDEPAWMVPAHVGIDDAERWTCRCERCAERFGGADPGGAHARGAGVPRVVGRRLPARGPRACRRARREEHRLPAALDRGHARHLRLEPRRGAAGPRDLRDRSVLEALERGGRPVRAPLRAAAARDVRAARRRLAALAAELRADGGGDPRARGRGRRRARGGSRRPVDVGLRGVRAHDASRDARCRAGVGGGERRAHRAAPARGARDARARDADERRRRDGGRRGRRGGRRARGRDRRDRLAPRGGRTARLRRRRHVGQARRARRGGARADVRLPARRGRRARRRRRRGRGGRRRARRGGDRHARRRRRGCGRRRSARAGRRRSRSQRSARRAAPVRSALRSSASATARSGRSPSTRWCSPSGRRSSRARRG